MPSGSILIISGTNRPGANALKVAKIVHGHYVKVGQKASLFSLADLPMEIFEPTSYETKPPSWPAIQQRVIDAAGLHFVVPEYRGSFPGVLKYFLEMIEPSCFAQKPIALVGEAAGIWGAFRPLDQLTQNLAYLDAFVFPAKVYLREINQLLDGDGRLTDAKLDGRIAKQTAAFAAFAGKFEKTA